MPSVRKGQNIYQMTKPGMNEIIRAFRRDSDNAGFPDCLQVRYKPDMFMQYCLSILKAIGELCIGLDRKETTTGSSGPGHNNFF